MQDISSNIVHKVKISVLAIMDYVQFLSNSVHSISQQITALLLAKHSSWLQKFGKFVLWKVFK